MSVVVPKSAIFAVTSQEDVDALYGKTKPPKDTDSARALRLSRTGSADPPPPVVVALKCGDREKTIVIQRGSGWNNTVLGLCTAYGVPFEKERDRYEIECVVKDGVLVPRFMYEKMNRSKLEAVAQLCKEKGLISRVILCQCKLALALSLWARKAAERFKAYETMRTLVGPVFSRNFVMMRVLRSVLALARPVEARYYKGALDGALCEAYARAARKGVELPAVTTLLTLNFEGDEYRRVLDAQVAGIEANGATADIFVIYGANGSGGKAYGIVDGERDADGNLTSMHLGAFMPYRLLLDSDQAVVSTPEDLDRKLEELTVCESPIHESNKTIFNLKSEVIATDARRAAGIITHLLTKTGDNLTPQLRTAFRMCVAGAGDGGVRGGLQLTHVCSVVAQERGLVTSRSSQADHRVAEKKIYQALVEESAAQRQALEGNIMELWAGWDFHPDLESAVELLRKALDERVEVETPSTVGWRVFENCDVASLDPDVSISAGHLRSLRKSGKTSADATRARRVDDKLWRWVEALKGYSRRPRIAELPGGFGGQANGVPHHGGPPGTGQGVAAAKAAQLPAAGAGAGLGPGAAAAVAAAGGGPPGGGPPGAPPGGGLGPMPPAAGTSSGGK